MTTGAESLRRAHLARALPLRRWLVMLATVLPLVLAALFPVGLMPTETRDGQTVLVLCSGNGPMLMVVDPVTGALRQAPATRGQTACDWAIAQGLADLVPAAGVALPPDAVVRAGPVLAVELWRPAYNPLGIWARGPPLPV